MEVVGKCVGVRSDSDVVYSKVEIFYFKFLIKHWFSSIWDHNPSQSLLKFSHSTRLYLNLTLCVSSRFSW